MAMLRPGPGVPDELLTLVGKIAIQWSYVDFLVSELTSGLKGLKQEDRAEIRASDLRAKASDARKLAEEKISDKSDKESLLRWLDQVASLAADRNLVQHGIIVYKSKEDHKEPKVLIFRGKYKDNAQPFSREQLATLLKEISDLSADLVALCGKYKFVELELLEKL